MSDSDLTALAYWAGLGLFLLAQLGCGYALVAKAPMWLRFVVSVANGMLGYLVWTLVVDSMGKSLVTLGGAAVLLFLAGCVGLMRNRSASPAPVGGHRAAR